MGYQIQFRDYDAWEDYLDTGDDHDGYYGSEDDAVEKIDELIERWPGTEFSYEER
jgi:hypothetical protein